MFRGFGVLRVERSQDPIFFTGTIRVSELSRV